jgi:hypothetical protein
MSENKKVMGRFFNVRSTILGFVGKIAPVKGRGKNFSVGVSQVQAGFQKEKPG